MSGTTSTTALMNLLLPLFAGSGTTTKTGGTSTTTTGTTASADSINNLQNILQQATANGADTTKLNALVTSLFTQAGQNFLPQIGAAASSGLYNSTTLGQVAAQAQGQAVNQAASTILNYQTQQNQIAEQAASQLAQATKTTTSTTTEPTVKSSTAPIINPAITLGGVGLLAAKTLSDKLGTTDPLLKMLGFGGSSADNSLDIPDGSVSALDGVNSSGQFVLPPDQSLTTMPLADPAATADTVAGPGGVDSFNLDSVLNSGFTGSGSDAFPASTLVDATGGAALDNGSGAAADLLNGSSSPSLWSDVSGVGADTTSTASDLAASATQDTVDAGVNAAVDSGGGSFLDSIFSLFG